MFWIAIARPKTSRPQPFACDCGVRKKPSVERGPKLIMAMRQPHSTITAGVRQPIADKWELDGSEIVMTYLRVPEKRPRSERIGAMRAAISRRGSSRASIATMIL